TPTEPPTPTDTPTPMDSPSPPSPTPTLWAAPASDAYGGVPADVPGLIIAAKFDHGGEGEAYSDTDVGNNGGVR
ncbi:unnamed protein product, partial [Scytosiphon promiscuus]